MKKILNYLWRAWFIFLAFLFIFIFGIPVILLSVKKSHFKYAYIFMRWWCLILFYGMGFRYQLIKETSEKIEKNQPYIFIANHTSIIDIMLMCVLHPHHPICFIGKAELAKIPIFNILYKRICILVDRKDPKSRAEVYNKAAKKMQHGQNIVIFPEGGVPDDTSVVLDTFKDGAFVLSEKHHFPIVVYTFVGLKEMFPFDAGKGFPGTVQVYKNTILKPTNDISQMKNEARNIILKTLQKNTK
ncbi:MAG: lysophospholipid acyltransferase family protein [Cruoricaptor ignavus]|nr:lysophospholipid acyltransferase family protein [Cruoricaptor ignavus]